MLAVGAKVQWVGDDALEKLEPARVAVDGTVLSNRVTAVRGTADNPMPTGEVVTKARDPMEPVLDNAGRLIDAIMGIEAVCDIRLLRGMLRKA